MNLRELVNLSGDLIPSSATQTRIVEIVFDVINFVNVPLKLDRVKSKITLYNIHK